MSTRPPSAKHRRNWGMDDSKTPILHVDMDAFFVEAEILRNPRLAKRPVIVGGSSQRGVVSSASYQARKFGVRAGMPITQACRKCPQAQVISADLKYYAQLSQRVMAVFETITPRVEKVSIDEAFLDVSGAVRLWGRPVEIARSIRIQIRQQLGLPASVGVAKNKLLAKIASAQAKPDGILLVPAEQTEAFLKELPVALMWGIGQATEKQLQARGITQVGQLAQMEKHLLVSLLGQAHGESLYYLSRGIDSRVVGESEREKSIGSETTFESNVGDLDQLRAVLLEKSHQVASRLRAGQWRCSTVTLKLRDGNFRTWTKSRTFERPTDLAHELYRCLKPLLESQTLWPGGIRLLGVTAKNLSKNDLGLQLAWSDNPKVRAAEKVLDQVDRKYGPVALRPASLVQKPK